MTTLQYLALFVAVAPLVGNLAALFLRSRGYHSAADWVVRMTPLAIVAASSKSREEAIRRVVEAVASLPIEADTIVAKVAAADVVGESMPPPSSAAPMATAVGQSVVPPALMPPVPPAPRAPTKMPPWSGGLVFALVLGGCVPILGCQMSPAQQAQAGKVLDASVDAGLELADHVCESAGRKEGFVEFLCTFVGSLTEDTGKSDMVELGPERKPIKVSVPDAMAEEFGRRHSAEQLARRE